MRRFGRLPWINVTSPHKSVRSVSDHVHRPTSFDERIQQACDEWLKRFTSADIPDPDTSVRYLLEAAQNSEKRNSHNDSIHHVFSQLCQRRLERQPLQYIVGDWDFRDLTLDMRPPVLIPRPETEQLVDIVLDSVTRLAGLNLSTVRFLDAGCGTGCIGLALAHECPKWNGVLLDANDVAVELANDNCRKCGLLDRVSVLHSTFADFTPSVPFDVVVSNPPYLPDSELENLQPELLHEDITALRGGGDGLDTPKSLIEACWNQQWLADDSSRFLILELHTDHPAILEQWLRQHHTFRSNIAEFQRFSDYNGRERYCLIRFKPSSSAPK